MKWIAGTVTNAVNAPRKLVIIGDGACGKTSLLSVFTLGYFPTVSVMQSESSWTRCLTVSL